MKRYEIIHLVNDINDYSSLIVATSHLDPLESHEQILRLQFDLQNKKICGTILFDMLSYIGDCSERYLTLNFNGKEFDLNSCAFVEFPKNSIIRKLSSNIYESLENNLYDTVLNYNQIKLLLNGVSV